MFPAMVWKTPPVDKSIVDQAGRCLIDPRVSPSSNQYDQAVDVVNDWRSGHAFPLNTFQTTLRRKANEVDSKAVVAQRIKRLSSISDKLTRLPRLTLSQLQDIAGCRAVVSSVSDIDALVKKYQKSGLKHTFIKKDDYITRPKPSGYRGVHLIYAYHSDRTESYNGLKVEVQLRSIPQHAWATAVEAVGVFRGQALKSSVGDKDWLRFFALTSSWIALQEGTPIVPGTTDDKPELCSLIQSLNHKINALFHLSAYKVSLQHTEKEQKLRGAHYYLLILNEQPNIVSITGYKQIEFDRAAKAYAEVEKRVAEKPDASAVLVSVKSLTELRKAYPNYFADTEVFVSHVHDALKQSRH